MIVNLKRCISILLAVMLLIGIIPTAYAVESGVDSIQSGEVISEGTDSIDPTEPTEPTEPPDIPDTQDDYAVMSVGSTQKSILLFDYADNGNYTTVLKSQVSSSTNPMAPALPGQPISKTWAGISLGMAVLPIRTNRCTALNHGAVLLPAPPATPLTER